MKIDDVLEALDGVEQRGEGWIAYCPAHSNSDTQALSVGIGKNGRVLLNCFAGCTFEEVRAALEDDQTGVTSVATSSNTPLTVDFGAPSDSAVEAGMRWWATKTRVPADVWEAMDCEPFENKDQKGVAFHFPGFNALKVRVSPKEIFWRGEVAPPLWPVPPVELEGPEAWIVEGESDCGTMRYADKQAFSTTKGSKGIPTVEMFQELVTRGLEGVVIAGDGDDPGENFMVASAANAHAAGLVVRTVHLRRLFDPFSGMVDLNDAWKACLEEAGERISAQRLLLERLESVTEPYVATLCVLDGEAALDFAEEEVDWIVPNLIAPGDKGIIIAAQKSYKTWICLDLVRTLITGHAFMCRPEWSPDRVSRVGFVEEEGSRNAFAKRMSTLQIDRDEWRESFRLIHRSGFRFTEPSAVAELIQIVRTHELDVLILDPLQRMIPGLDENSASDMAVIWDAVADLHRAQPDLVVLLVHHSGKGKEASWDAARGSSRHAGEVDFGIFVQREKERGHLRVRVDGRDIPEYLGTGEYFTTRVEVNMSDNPAERRFVLDARELEVNIVERPKAREPAPDLEDATAERRRAGVWEAIAGGCQTIAELIEQTGLTRTTVQRVLAELENDGVVTRMPGSPGTAMRYQTNLQKGSHEESTKDAG